MKSEKRLIDCEQAKRATYEEIFWTESEQAVVRNFLSRLPRVDAVEVVHGRWKKRKEIVLDDEMVGYRCSNCNTTWDAATNYCPNCGADMRERKDNV